MVFFAREKVRLGSQDWADWYVWVVSTGLALDSVLLGKACLHTPADGGTA